MMDIRKLTIKTTHDCLKRREFTEKELRKEFLSLIEKENKNYNAYLSVFGEENPEVVEVKSNHFLAGVPSAIKDNILVEGKKTTAGSKILGDYVASYDATVIKRLRKHGAIFLGKTNLDEFAMGSTSENSAFGVSKNPYDTTRVAGGSSGGSAAAVASGLAVYALGSDTGGSIRTPAAYCGVVGLKPTYGRVSRYGLIAMASSFDQIGPITKTVEDAAIVLEAIAGKDNLDSTSVAKDVLNYSTSLERGVKGLKIAVPKQFFSEGLDPTVAEKVNKAIGKLESLGAKTELVSLPMTEYAIAAYYVIVPSEVSANLARFDGIKYGYSNRSGKDLLSVYQNSRAEGFGPEVKRRIMIGTYTLSAGYYEAYYLKAQKVRALIKKEFDKIFEDFDIVVTPTTPTVANKIGELDTPLAAYLADVFTVQVNLAGLPAISVPCGFVEKEGKNLPIGLQIIGRHFDEKSILQAAFAFENS
jgi:aspartyl-tRNA(Asn)/glutamyl-tRNA(Gln) amidotransferase subunit A